MTNLHDLEEQDFGRGPRLWDADPEVCCAAFQLGACPHTEAPSEYDEIDFDAEVADIMADYDAAQPAGDENEPF